MNNNILKITKKKNSGIVKLLAERNHYQQCIHNFERELTSLPEGTLTRKIIKGNAYFYQILKEADGLYVQKYLHKYEKGFVAAVQRRHFIIESLKQLKNNIKKIDEFIKNYNPYDATEVLLMLPKVYQNPEDILLYNSSEYVTWGYNSYKKNESYPEGLINYTSKGIKVRSKSEALIGTVLESNNILYHYEEELSVDNHLIYPDFTILKPDSGDIIYWEHFGIKNNLEYSISMERKLVQYTRHNIIPWESLIMTFDNSNGSIDTRTIQKLIQLFIKDE